MPMQESAAELIGEAAGRRSRVDPVTPGTGGPAGNAQLTAWTGLLLLVLIAAQLLTLIDVRGLISFHIVIGVLLLPPALLKTSVTGWRLVRYYTGHGGYRSAGVPPTPLRLLGPLVVGSTVALLGSGLTLVALGAQSSRRILFDALGHRVDAVTIHQAVFIVWAAVTGLHLVMRLVPAVTLATRRHPDPVPGSRRRGWALAAVLAAAAVTATLVLHAAGSWRSQVDRRPQGHRADQASTFQTGTFSPSTSPRTAPTAPRPAQNRAA